MDLSLISKAIFLPILKTKIIILSLSFFCLYQNIFPQVNTEKFRIATDSIGFSVRSGIDFTLMTGNTDFSFLGTNSRFNYNWGEDYTFLVVNGSFGQNNGVSFFSQAFLHLRNVNSVADLVQLEEFVQYDNNKQILLLHRALCGGGFRFKILQNDELIMRIGTSTFLEHETYDLNNSSLHRRITNVVRLSLYWTSLLDLQRDVTFLSTTYLQSAIGEFRDVRILSENALNIKLGKTVDLVINLHMRFDNLPPDEVGKFDLVSKIGIAMNF